MSAPVTLTGTKPHSSPMTTETISVLIEELERLHGHIPYGLHRRLSDLGVTLRRSYYERATRTRCSAILRTGAQCRRTCKDGDMCAVHLKARARPVPAKCTETTAKDQPCKCTAFRGLNMCWRHAKKAGVLPEIPDECAICYDAMSAENRIKTKCGHYFHSACFEKWAMSKGEIFMYKGKMSLKGPCPMCRTVVPCKLKVPEWYCKDRHCVTVFTSGRQWAERLKATPMSPNMTADMITFAAHQVGLLLLNYISEEKKFPSNDTIVMLMNAHLITPHSPLA